MKEILKEIKNEVFNDIGRASDMLWIQIGDLVVMRNYKGKEVKKGKYAIHVQCPWRFVYLGKVILGNMDIYMPRKGVSEAEFDWSEIGNSVFDEEVEKIKRTILPIKIKDVLSDDIGNLQIIFEGDLVFEIMPNSSVNMEFWRFINNQLKKHTVVFD